MRIHTAILRIIEIAEDLDKKGSVIEAEALTSVATRIAQFNAPFDNERVPPSQRMWKWEEQDQEMKDLDDARNRDPRFTTPEYQNLPGGESSPADEGANNSNPDGLSIFDMGGRDHPIVTGPAQVENEAMSPSTSPLSLFEDKNLPSRDNPAESYKRFPLNRM